MLLTKMLCWSPDSALSTASYAFHFLPVFTSIPAEATLTSEESQYIINSLARVTLNSSDKQVMGSCSLVLPRDQRSPNHLRRNWLMILSSASTVIMAPHRREEARVVLAELRVGTSRLWYFLRKKERKTEGKKEKGKKKGKRNLKVRISFTCFSVFLYNSMFSLLFSVLCWKQTYFSISCLPRINQSKQKLNNK